MTFLLLDYVTQSAVFTAAVAFFQHIVQACGLMYWQLT